MLFHYKDPNADLITILEGQATVYKEKSRENERNSDAYANINNYAERISNAINILKLYKNSRYSKTKISASSHQTMIIGNRNYCNLDDTLTTIEYLTAADISQNHIKNINIYMYLSISSAILGIASIILGIALKSLLYATMNPWLAFGTIVMPLIVIGGAMLLSGFFGAIKASNEKRNWIAVCSSTDKNTEDEKPTFDNVMKYISHPAAVPQNSGH